MPVAIAAAAIGLDRLVETDTEKIQKVIYTATKAVEEENITAIDKLIAENYNDSYHKTKKQLMSHCKDKLAEPFAEKNIARIVSIEKSSPKATVLFTVRVIFDKRSYLSQMYKQEIFTKVKAELEKKPDSQWLISSIEILELDRLPTSWQGIQH